MTKGPAVGSGVQRLARVEGAVVLVITAASVAAPSAPETEPAEVLNENRLELESLLADLSSRSPLLSGRRATS